MNESEVEIEKKLKNLTRSVILSTSCDRKFPLESKWFSLNCPLRMTLLGIFPFKSMKHFSI